MLPLPSDVVAFSDYLISFDKTKGARRLRWQRGPLLEQSGQLCELCLADLSQKQARCSYVSAIVPPHLGGHDDYENRMVCCASCARKRARQDIVEPTFLKKLGGRVPDHLLKKRENLLLHGENHLTPLWPYAPKDRFEAILLERHQHSRFRVFASDDPNEGLIGWKRKEMCPQDHSGAAVLLHHRFQTTRVPHPTLVIYRVPNLTYLDAIWALIDLNAIVRPVPCPDAFMSWETSYPDDWRTTWRFIFNHYGDNRRRHKRGQQRLPWAPKIYSQNPKAAWMRTCHKKTRDITIQQAKMDRMRGESMMKVWQEGCARDSYFSKLFAQTPAQLQQIHDEAIWLLSTPKQRWKLRQNNPKWPIPRFN